MLESINLKTIEELLNVNLNLQLKLKPYFYYSNKDLDKTLIMGSRFPFKSELYSNDPVVSFGNPIIEIRKTETCLLPPILDYLVDEYQKVHLGLDEIKQISFGKRIRINEKDMICFIVDEINNIQSFGIITNKQYQPLVDLGWFIRSGS
ncbi:MAG: hypothetical protein ACW99A_02430 [Candidatus Kariarchaeaceae archaeon]|jgi:hypothetical protein